MRIYPSKPDVLLACGAIKLKNTQKLTSGKLLKLDHQKVPLFRLLSPEQSNTRAMTWYCAD
jgi:hypothetical protein